MRFSALVTAISGLMLVSVPAQAEHHENDTSGKPKLVVAIAVDQLSSDLFAEYRGTFTGGLQRLASGAVFPSGYQSHAATETCPGHATIMTGAHPGRAGIIANNWIDLDAKRDDKTIYCAEDERVAGTSFGDIAAATQGDYVPSAWHLLVPTLGERLKKISPKSRNVAVSGKDRAALMMGGNDVDAIYWFKGKGFETAKGKKLASSVRAVNEKLANTIDQPRPPIGIPPHCQARNAKISHGEGKSVGDYSFGRPAGASRFFRFSPDFDSVTLDVASGLVGTMKLGRGEAIDVLSIGLSATDYIGHVFGTEGLEMCIQMAELDRQLGLFFDKLDAAGIDYLAVLTADHGGLDLPERARLQGMPQAERLDPKLNTKAIGEQVEEKLNLRPSEPLLHADGPFGDYYVSRKLDSETGAKVKLNAMALIATHPQVEAVLDGDAIATMSMPQGPVEEWSLAERARASYHPDRSGDFLVLLKKSITPIPTTDRGYVATHGSPWDYDRRVPILFWRKGMTPFEQPLSVKTVDIAPTLASIIGVRLPTEEIDGRCLDIDGGEASNCD